jgi:hypothetical protein
MTKGEPLSSAVSLERPILDLSRSLSTRGLPRDSAQLVEKTEARKIPKEIKR